jgi:hypothetical protein
MNQRLCLLRPEQACNVNRDCASYFCKEEQCTRDDGHCQTNEDCLAPSVCGPTRLCLLPEGRLCSSNAHCLTGFCVNNVCQRNTDVRCPSTCPDFSLCILTQCFPLSVSTVNQEIQRRGAVPSPGRPPALQVPGKE